MRAKVRDSRSSMSVSVLTPKLMRVVVAAMEALKRGLGSLVDM